MQYKNKKRLAFFGFATRLHVVVISLTFFFYLLMGVLGGPSLILNDIKDKYAWAATQMTLYIMGMPNKPVISAQALCFGATLPPVVRLNWTFTDATTAYNIDRDGQPLVQGLTTLTYQDNLVQNSTQYFYVVTAIGPVGSVASDPVIITTGDCTTEPPTPVDPEAEILTFDGKNIAVYQGDVETKVKRPAFSGTTNLVNANLDFTIAGPTPIVATGMASLTGFWSWIEPADLMPGNYTFSLKATDPLNNTRFITKNLNFRIISDAMPQPSEEDNGGNREKEKKKKSSDILSTLIQENPPPPSEAPQESPQQEEIVALEPVSVSIRVKINNPGNIAYQERFLTETTALEFFNSDLKSIKLDYQIIKPDGKVVYEFSEDQQAKNGFYEKNIYIPQALEQGNYKFRIMTKVGNMIISAEEPFQIKTAPILKLSNGIEMTYKEIISKTGWLLLILFLMFLIVFTMFGIEHALSMQAHFHPTGKEFKPKGFITTKNGKEVSK